MKFNDKQKEGLTKGLDTVWVAALIAVMVGLFVDNKLSWIQVGILLATGAVCLGGALWLRKGEEI